MATSGNLKASVTPVIPKGTPSPLRLASPPQIRNGRALTNASSSSLALDLDNIQRTVNDLHTAAQTSPTVSQILVTDAAGNVTAAFGATTYQGVRFLNYLSELHVGDPLQTHNPAEALFNAQPDGSVSIGQSGWVDVHDPFEGNAAWIGTQFDGTVITDAVDNGAGAIRLTVPNHTLATGSVSTVRNMGLWNVPNANGTWTVTVISATQMDLQGSIWSGPFVYVDQDGDIDPSPEALPVGIPTYLPTIDRMLQITSISNNAGTMHITTAIAHGYETATRVNIPPPGPGGFPAPGLVGQWLAWVTSATEFDLYQDATPVPTPVPYVAGYTTGGTVVAYFPGMLADSFAVGPSFQQYRLRAFPNGDLRIKNADISLTSPSGSVILDPAIPGITLTSPAGTIQLNAATEQITMTSAAAQIVMDAITGRITLGTVPHQIVLDSATSQITLSSGVGGNILLDAVAEQIIISKVGTLAKIVIDASALSINLYDALGNLSASLTAATGTLGATTVNATDVNASGTVSAAGVSSNGFTASGAPGLTQTVTVGTSTLDFTDGILTGYTP